MIWIDLVTAAALIQYLAFSTLVALARGKYGVKAPATTGHDMYERAFRVQMNTLELLVAFVPALWMAARYWPAGWVAAVGAVYVLGRFVYRIAYMDDPAKRGLGFGLSMVAVLALIAAAVVGAVLAALKG